MTTEKDIGRLEAEVENIKTGHASFETDVKQRLTVMEAQLQQILDAANMGKGAWWLLLKLGAALTAVAAAVSWILREFR